MTISLWVFGWILDLVTFGIATVIVGGSAGVAALRGKSAGGTPEINPFAARLAALLLMIAQLFYIVGAIGAASLAVGPICSRASRKSRAVRSRSSGARSGRSTPTASGSLRRTHADAEVRTAGDARKDARVRLAGEQSRGRLLDRNGNYLLPIAFTAGSPPHSSYGAGHATVAGACVAVEGELYKIACNVAMGRSMGDVHWRTDNTRSLRLGEQIAAALIRSESLQYAEKRLGGDPEPFWTFTSFNGDPVRISNGDVFVSGTKVDPKVRPL